MTKIINYRKQGILGPVSGTVSYQWQDNTGVGRAQSTDNSILVVYCPARNQCIYTTTGANRAAGADAFQVSSFSGEQVHTFIGFLSADGKNIASSMYTGALTVL